MTRADVSASLNEIRTPRSRPGLLASAVLPNLIARAGIGLAAGAKGPWRFGRTVVAVRHAHVRELLARDLEFRIGPINAQRIDEVNGPFVLGMDRSASLAAEREALYRGLAAVDVKSIRANVAARAASALAATTTIDAVGDFARPIAAATARSLFGLNVGEPALFMEVARAVFAHTFLNLGGDPVIRKRALAASLVMRSWFVDEIARRRSTGTLGTDMMGVLLAQGALDDDGVRRTLGGMLVGSIDTTASAVAKIVAVIGRDALLAQAVARDVDDRDRMRGWCWEALRRWPHNPILLRQAAVATLLGDTTIEAGDRVIAWTQAAMLDPDAFPDPGRLRPDRPPATYLHFGDAIHACAGRAVNAFQIPTLVAALFRRGVASVGRIDWAGPFPNRLPVDFR